MDASRVIDLDLWNRAHWKGVLFRTQEQTVPVLALIFTDQAAAEAIMKGWHDALGEHDHDEVLRIAIIEGEIPGQAPGYTVHIGPNLVGLVAAAGHASLEPLVFATRILRMEHAQDSPHLVRFKQAYAQQRRYWLIAAVFTPWRAEPLLNWPYRVGKTKIEFRLASEISGENDIDRIVLARPESQRARSNECFPA